MTLVIYHVLNKTFSRYLSYTTARIEVDNLRSPNKNTHIAQPTPTWPKNLLDGLVSCKRTQLIRPNYKVTKNGSYIEIELQRLQQVVHLWEIWKFYTVLHNKKLKRTNTQQSIKCSSNNEHTHLLRTITMNASRRKPINTQPVLQCISPFLGLHKNKC